MITTQIHEIGSEMYEVCRLEVGVHVLGGPGSLVRRWKEGKERSDGGIDPHRGFPFPSIERDASTLSSHLVDDPLIIAAVITVGGGFLFFAATFASWGVKVKRVGWGCFTFLWGVRCFALLRF